MKFSTQREEILKPLQVVGGVIERRQTLPILSNVLLDITDHQLTLTATDLEVELVSGLKLVEAEGGKITLPARKFLDICRTLPEDADFKFSLDGERVKIQSGKSRFTLSTLPAEDYPLIENIEKNLDISITQGALRQIIGNTLFAMAQQDVRYYLNGLMLEISRDKVTAVATDGHRLSLCETAADVGTDEKTEIIIPRKGVQELYRLLQDNDDVVKLKIGTNHIQVETGDIRFTSKLIDGKFPDYQRVIPILPEHSVTADRESLKQALTRTSILSNEKYRGIRLQLTAGNLQAMAHNPELEEAEEILDVDYEGKDLEIGFNVNYIIDALSVINTDTVLLYFGDANSSCLIVPQDQPGCKHVIMPMRL